MILFVLFAIILAVLIHLFVRIPLPQKINGVYSVPSKYYPLKFFLIKKLIIRRQAKTKKSNAAPTVEPDIADSQFGGGGKRSIEYLEKKHTFPAEHDRAGDCVFWNASNSDGWWLALGMAQRPNDTINLFFVVKVPGVGTFVNEQLPVTSNVKSVPSDTYYETDSGFRVHCVQPMQEWQLSFRGNLISSEHCHPDLKAVGEGRKATGAQAIAASFELKWSNYGEYFDFDVDVSAEAVSRSLAREPWSRELFKKLKETHQSHYEQFGHLQGRFQVGEHSFDDVKMVSMRDHTITKYRNWSQIRRYIMLVYHLEDGTCINTSLVSMPDAVFSHLEFGYIITSDKKKVAVDHININLHELGEDKNFPRQFEYTFTAGPYFYTVKVNAKEVVSFKMGLDLACYVQEHMCEYRANGLKGWGFAEVEYRISPY